MSGRRAVVRSSRGADGNGIAGKITGADQLVKRLTPENATDLVASPPGIRPRYRSYSADEFRRRSPGTLTDSKVWSFRRTNRT
jgi:hypothetical protein